MSNYDEIYDACGEERAPYVSLESRTGVKSTRPSARLIEELGRRGVVGNEGLYPVPLVLDESEYIEKLVPGMFQRAFVLQELFADIAMGSGKIVESGLLTKDDLDHILSTEGVDYHSLRRMWRGQALDQIRFVYGPDLVRHPSGRWVLLEDNVGCVGGVADGPVVLGRYLEAVDLPLHPDLNAQPNLEESLIAFLHRVGLTPGAQQLYGISGTSSNCAGSGFNYQTTWKGDALRSLGIAVKQPEELLDEITAGAIQPSAIINLSTTIAPAMQRLAASVFEDRDMPIFGAPCTGLVASKCFHALGDTLILLYLNEQALLATPRTRLILKPPPRLPDEGILKRANGCGGTEVFFLDEPLDKGALLEELKRWGPCGAVIQDQVSRSVLAPVMDSVEISASVEIRPIVYVYGWRTAAVDQVVTGRATPRGSRRGNISQGAQYLPVLRERVT